MNWMGTRIVLIVVIVLSAVAVARPPEAFSSQDLSPAADSALPVEVFPDESNEDPTEYMALSTFYLPGTFVVKEQRDNTKVVWNFIPWRNIALIKSSKPYLPPREDDVFFSPDPGQDFEARVWLVGAGDPITYTVKNAWHTPEAYVFQQVRLDDEGAPAGGFTFQSIPWDIVDKVEDDWSPDPDASDRGDRGS